MYLACVARPGLVAVIGAPGVGKSRLREETEQRLRAGGTEVITLAGTEGTRTVRLGAFAPLLPLSPGQDETHLITHLVHSLTSPEGTTVVSVDDAHLLDDLSIGVLATAVREGVRVLCTIRRPAALPDALQDLLLADSTHQIHLAPLKAEAVVSLAAEHLGGPLTPTACEAVVRSVEGNPLLLREMIADATASRTLRRGPDGFDLYGALEVGDRVARLVRSRVDRLPEEMRELVELVALAEQLPVVCLDPPREQLLITLEEMALVKVEHLAGCWTIRPAHPSVGQAVALTLPRVHALQRLRTLCDLAGAVSDPPAGLARATASWFHERNVPAPAAVAAVAAWEALVSLDLDHAVALAAPAARSHWRAAFVLAETARWRGDVRGSADHLSRAAELAPDSEALRRIVMAHSALEAWQCGDIPTAIKVLHDGAARTDDGETSAFLLCEAAMLATLLGDFEGAVHTSRTLLATFPTDPLILWNTTVNLGYAQVMRGSLDDVDQALGTARAVYPSMRREQPEGADFLASLEIGAALLAGDLTSAASVASSCITTLEADGAPAGSAAAIAADTLLLAGDDRALTLAGLSVDHLRRYDAYGTLPMGLAHAAIVYLAAGDRHRATELLDGLDESAGDVRSRSAHARALAALHADAHERAADLAWAGAEVALDSEHLTVGCFAGLEALAHLPSTKRARKLAEVCERRDTPLLRMAAELSRALLSRDPRQAFAAADTFRRSGSPYLAALALIAWAKFTDRAEEARRASARAHAVLSEGQWLQGAPFLWTPDDGLTNRELQVALAAAAGSTNKEIGSQHFLSARTVGNHLYSVYSKLGIAGREDLRGWLT